MNARGDLPESADVLGANLQALLRRAYVPALPSREFRARAERAFLEALAQRPAAPRAAHAAPARPAASGHPVLWLRPALAAAAVVLVSLFAGWWILDLARSTATLEQIVAGGDVAVRDGADADWRPVSPHGGLARERLAGFLELATPPVASLQVDVPSADTITARPSSHARLLGPGNPLATDAAGSTAVSLVATLEAGGLQLVHAQGGAPWLAETPAGTLLLDHGVLDVALVDGGRASVRLREGSAWLMGSQGLTALPADETVLLALGALLPPPVADSLPPPPPLPEPGTPQPEPLVAPTPPAPAVVTVPGELAGRVTDAATGAPVPAFRLSIVRDRIVADENRVLDLAVEHADGVFSWPGIVPDKWALFVQADGYAVASRTGLVVSADKPVPPLTIALERGSSVRGYVLDDATELPIEGALVLSETDAPARDVPLDPAGFDERVKSLTRTAADGSFELAGLSSGEQILRVSASGHAPQWSGKFPLGADGAQDGLLFRLGPAAGVAGRVTTAEEKPWQGAMVLAWIIDPTGERSSITFSVAETDEAGEYTIPDLPECIATMILLGDEASLQAGQQPIVQPAPLVAGTVTTLNFVQPTSGARMHGRVLTSEGKPIHKIGVSICPSGTNDSRHWLATSTAEDGSYNFAGVPAGPHDIYVGDAGASAVSFVTRVLVPASGDLEQDLRMPTGRITGTVSLASDEPLPPVVLLLEGERQDAGGALAFGFVGKAMTGDDGRYVLENVPDGSYRVIAFAVRGNWGAERRDGVVVTNGVANGPADLHLSPGGSVRVTVRRATGEPVPGARLAFTDAEGKTFNFDETQLTDAAGIYRVSGVKPGRWYVSAQAAGLQRAELAIEVQPGAEQPAELVLAATP